MCCGCKSCIVLAAQCAVCVRPVLYLHYTASSVCRHCRVHAGISPVSYPGLHYCQRSMTYKLFLYCMHVCLHYCQRSVLCIRVLYCACTTASVVCCACKPCVVFALLPAQCVVRVSPVLCLHYCERSVLCV